MTIAANPTSVELRMQVMAAYDKEIEQLDAHDYRAWSQWLHPEFRYEVPIPIVRDDYLRPQFSEAGFLAVETRSSIDLWVQRLADDLVNLAYAENPPLRYRHFISGIGISGAIVPDELAVRSNVLLTWTRPGEAPDLMAGERQDMLSVTAEGLRLRRRTVLLDSTVVHLSHLRVIF